MYPFQPVLVGHIRYHNSRSDAIQAIHGVGRYQGRIEGYAAALQDVQGMKRVEHFRDNLHNKENRFIRTSGGTAITKDAQEKYLQHKAKHHEYRHLLKTGLDGSDGDTDSDSESDRKNKGKKNKQNKKKHRKHAKHHTCRTEPSSISRRTTTSRPTSSRVDHYRSMSRREYGDDMRQEMLRDMRDDRATSAIRGDFHPRMPPPPLRQGFMPPRGSPGEFSPPPRGRRGYDSYDDRLPPTLPRDFPPPPGARAFHGRSPHSSDAPFHGYTSPLDEESRRSMEMHRRAAEERQRMEAYGRQTRMGRDGPLPPEFDR